MKDFIAVKDNALPDELCDDLIKRFESSKTIQRPGETGAGVDTSKKRSTDINITAHKDWQDMVGRVVEATYPHLEDYIKENFFMLVGALSPTVMDPETQQPTALNGENFERLGLPNLRALIGHLYRYGVINMQKYDAGKGGYPHWHSEIYPQDQRCEPLHRVLLWMYFLNDVDEAGETEFYYQERKIEPRKGRMVIAPAGFTHTHRGNMPKSNDKYIITSWVMFHRAEQMFGQKQG